MFLFRTENAELPAALPCKEYYIFESGSNLENTIEIIDEKRGKIYLREMKSDVNEDRRSHRNLFTRIKKAFNTPTRSHSATSSRILKSVKSSVGAQQTLSYATPKRSLRK